MSCDSPSVSKDGNSPFSYCQVQGMFLYLFSLWSAVWWFVSAVELFINVVFRLRLKGNALLWKERIFSIVGWLFPVPGFFTILFADYSSSFGGEGTTPWCFTAGSDLEWAFFYYPIVIFGFVGFLMIAAVVFTLFQNQKSRNKKRGLDSSEVDNTRSPRSSTRGDGETTKGTKGRRRTKSFRHYIRPIVFFGMFLIVFGFLAGFNATTILTKQDVTASAQAYVICLLTKPGGVDTCGEHPEDRPPFSSWFAMCLFAMLQGTFFASLYGTMKDNFVLWGRCCSNKGITRFLSRHATKGSSGSGSRSRPSRSPISNAPRHIRMSVLKK